MKKIKMRFLAVCLTLLLGVCAPMQLQTADNGQLTVTSITKIDAKKKSKTVYITRTGECYHKRKCGNGTYYKSTLKHAKSLGLRKCKKCYK